jgi:hypothetical protein
VDKIDPDFLVRDTRIYAAIAHRLLTSPLLPLDVRAAAEDLLSHLRDWQEKSGDRFDLSPAVTRAKEVAEWASPHQARLDAGEYTLADAANIPRLNDAVMRAERAMVRLNYTRSDPFEHDPALSQPPVPLLAPIEDLSATDVGSDEENETLTLLVRRRNRVLHGLSEAGRALGAGLALYETGGG